MPDVHVAVVSSGRPGNVPAMEAHLAGLGPTWYVGTDEAGDYRYAGADRVVEAGGLIDARNAALDAAGRLPCVQLSDDLRRMGWATGTTRDSVAPLTVAAAVDRLLAAMAEHGAQLAGAAPTDNPYFAKPRVHTSAFIVGDFIVVAASCPLRFDPALRLKEDYDYTLQHLAAVGRVARLDQLLATFVHRTNRGGAVAYRTPDAEQQAIEYLQAKWPACIRPNPRRPNEVLMRWRAAA